MSVIRDRRVIRGHRGRWLAAAFATGAASLGSLAVAVPGAVQAGTPSEIAVPSLDSAPLGIAAGPDGTMWFVENTGAVGRIDSSGGVTEYAVPPASNGLIGALNSITEGPDGAMWFTDESALAPRIGRIDPATGSVTMYALPTSGSPSFAGAQPLGIVSGPGPALWFTAFGAALIGRIDTSGHVTTYTVPQQQSARGITVGPDGALWFTEDAGRIGRLDPATGAFTIMRLASGARLFPAAITTGPDGALWFTEFGASSIGRLDPATGTVTSIPTLTRGAGPVGITTGPDGDIWFTEGSAGNAGRIIPGSLQLSEFPLSSRLDGPIGIAAGADGHLWITETGADRIASVDPANPPAGAANTAPARGTVPAVFQGQCTPQLCTTQVNTGGTFRIKTFTQALPAGAIRLTGELIGPPNPDGSLTLVAPVSGAELASRPVPVPGGLLGTFPLLGPIVGKLVGPANRLSITLTLAGPVDLFLSPLAAIVPVTLHLNNQILGSSCVITPVTQHLAITLTSERANDPLVMSWQPAQLDARDNTLSVPGAQGCGPLPLVFDAVIDQQLGLPSASGNNSIDLPGVLSIGAGVHH